MGGPETAQETAGEGGKRGASLQLERLYAMAFRG